jgi:N-glycosylase/DNA lyase
VGKTREVNRAAVSRVTALSSLPHFEDWSPWKVVAISPSPSAAVLAETLDGGQAFRWNPLPNDDIGTIDPRTHSSAKIWQGIFGACVVRLTLDSRGVLHWSAPKNIAPQVAPSLGTYLDLKRDSAALTDALPWRSDRHLALCLETFPGLRILRQPFGETLLGFLCSATKQIVQIKQMLALLAERHGAVLSDSRTQRSRSVSTFHRLPAWSELAKIPENELRACLLGFRARYIHQTAQFLAANPGWLEETEKLPYALAKERLCSLPGVGEKVADCVLLFGAGRLEAFPVDVWIIKTMEQRYGLQGWKPAQIAHFGRTHFGPLAGLAQQYLFAYERRTAKTKAVTS